MATYTVVTRDPNSWTPDGVHTITWTCGHKHKTLRAAMQCLRRMGDAACSYHARIERSDGQPIDPDEELRNAQELA